MDNKWLVRLAYTWLLLPLLAWGWPWGVVSFAVMVIVPSVLEKINSKLISRVFSGAVVIVATLAVYHIMIAWFAFTGISALIEPAIYLLINVVLLIPTKDEQIDS